MTSQDAMVQTLQPDRQKFVADPFGYSALAWHRWVIARDIAGFPGDPTVPPTSEDLKSPVLWISQAHALSTAATVVLDSSPDFANMPLSIRGMCDSQYCAAGLMLVGYSLEICLKGMLIIKLGVSAYIAEEHKHKNHRLVELAEFIPELNEKDKAILKLLSQFVQWAGRYPDPGSGRKNNAEELFRLSAQHQISGQDLFSLSARVMRHVQTMV